MLFQGSYQTEAAPIAHAITLHVGRINIFGLVDAIDPINDADLHDTRVILLLNQAKTDQT
jgi:hypothetical protein